MSGGPRPLAARPPAPVDALLAAACRAFLAGGSAAETRAELATVRGREELLLRRADQEGLSGVLATVLDGQSWAAGDRQAGAARLAAALGARRDRIFAHGARTLETLDRLGAALAAAGLRAMALKGAALLAGPYRQRLGCRPVSDLDLLVRREQLGAVQAVLFALGFRPLGVRWRGDGIELDLHTALGRSALLGERRDAYRFDALDVWRRAVPSPVGGPAMVVLPTELQVVHLAVHGLKHAFGRWIWLLDLPPLLAGARHDEVLSLASAVGADRALASCAVLLREALGVATALDGLAGLPALGRLETAWLRQIAERRRPVGLGRMVAGLAIPGTVERLAYWRQVALPAGDTLARAAPGAPAAGLRRRWLAGTLGPRLARACRLLGRAAVPPR